jgi:hypothetical protein
MLSIMSKRRVLIVLGLIFLVGAVWCFFKSVQYFDAGIMYVAETSSNPRPSERAKIMGPLLMGKSRAWLRGGLVFTALMVALLVINWLRSVDTSDRQRTSYRKRQLLAGQVSCHFGSCAQRLAQQCLAAETWLSGVNSVVLVQGQTFNWL